jgi:hypothetical protein
MPLRPFRCLDYVAPDTAITDFPVRKARHVQLAFAITFHVTNPSNLIASYGRLVRCDIPAPRSASSRL